MGYYFHGRPRCVSNSVSGKLILMDVCVRARARVCLMDHILMFTVTNMKYSLLMI